VDVREHDDQGASWKSGNAGTRSPPTVDIGELQPGDNMPMTGSSARLGGGVVVAATDSEASEPWDNWNVARASACMVVASLISGWRTMRPDRSMMGGLLTSIGRFADPEAACAVVERFERRE
jgi:hypothetical protein